MRNPNIIGGAVPRSQNRTTHLPRKVLLKKLWDYLGRNRLLLALAVVLSLTSSMLSLYGPKLSGQAINAIDLGTGQVDADLILVLSDGMVIGRGTHDTLMDTCPEYRTIALTQMGAEGVAV